MLKSLIKNEFWHLLNSLSMRKKSTKRLMTIILGLILSLAVYLSVTYSMMVCESFLKINAISSVPLMIYFSTSVIIVIFGVLYSSGVLFDFKDYDLLMSLPMKTQTIVWAKLIFMYLANLVITIVVMVPAVIVWMFYANATFTQVVLQLMSLPLVAVIPMKVSNLISLMVSYLSRYVRHKGVFITCFTMVLLAAFMLVSSLSTQLSLEGLTNVSLALESKIHMYYPPSILFSGIVKGRLIDLLLYFASSAVLAFVFVLLLTKVFKLVHSGLESVRLRSSNKEVLVKHRSSFTSLLRKEFNVLTSVPIYAINTSFGVLLGLGFSVYILFFDVQLKLMLIMNPTLIIFIPIIIASVFNMSPTTTSSVSLEGKYFWIAKSLPIDPKEVYMSKVVFNIILNGPVALLVSICVSWVFKFSLTWSLLTILFTVLTCILFSFLGLVLNLKFPNYDWLSPSVPVKQGLPVILSILFLGLLLGGLGVVVFMIGDISLAVLVYMIAMALMAIVIFSLYSHLNRYAHDYIIEG
ncbi:hypothetical protein EZV73_03805 [Acidaminobacter sp. JC074]|uniref:hypothetical protein n=1 Tax=Acidaminobacter sp. JC074 TaxID=2530199 RepID=UPI001F0DFC40|nr:hypothetical protein [Acidaminobacter sp. JC074]MCH4886676.1 hypothetical protein [Acidaminobacter sp. JC074]